MKDVKSQLALSQETLIQQQMFQMERVGKETQDLMKIGFSGLALKNDELKQQNQELKEEIQLLRKELESVSSILNQKLEAERALEERRKRRRNRQRLPKREAMTMEYYDFLLSEASSLEYRSYRGARLRLALLLLQVTGVRIAELLPLKMKQIQTLFDQSWIAIDRVKKGPANHKAFLTKEGKKIVKNRKEDLELISYFKNDDSYLFTAENSEKPLTRESFTTIINEFLRKSAQQLEGTPNLRSHSFRIGYITQLWRDTKDIEFVRQTIGHGDLNSTSAYVKSMSEKERQKRMEHISSVKNESSNIHGEAVERP